MSLHRCHQLVPFSPVSDFPPFELQVHTAPDGSALSLDFQLVGPMEALLIPQIEKHSAFRDELWTSTCFEIFIQKKSDASKYEEWNFSPSGCWAHYYFTDYRVRDLTPPPKCPSAPICTTVSSHLLRLEVSIPLPDQCDFKSLRYGLSCVLQSATGPVQYWAILHPAEKADFHDPRSRSAELFQK